MTLKKAERGAGILNVDYAEKALLKDHASDGIFPYPAFGDLVSNDDQRSCDG